MTADKKAMKPPAALREAAKAMRAAAEQGIADTIAERSLLDGYSRVWLGGYRHGINTAADALEQWADDIEGDNE